MICKKCKEENVIKAKYCRNCGEAFSEEERKAAYDQTIYGKLDFIKKIKEHLDLSFITGNKFFRIGVLIIILVYIIFNGVKSKDFMIEKSNQYEVQYNEKLNEYYLLSEEKTVHLQLYLPEEPKSIEIISFNLKNEENSRHLYQMNETMVVETDPKQYYVVTAHYENSTQTLKFYLINK